MTPELDDAALELQEAMMDREDARREQESLEAAEALISTIVRLKATTAEWEISPEQRALLHQSLDDLLHTLYRSTRRMDDSINP